jgi:hypothetical protein
MEGLRSCVAQVGCLALLVGGVAAGWILHDDIADWWRARTPAPAAAEPSEELAGRAEERLSRLLRSGSGGEVRLGPAEVESLLRYRVAPALPPGVASPSVALGDSTLDVAASLDLRRVMGERVPELVRRLLGDSARVTATLRPDVPRPGRLRLTVEELRAGAVQVPSAMVPWMLGGLGLPTSGGGRAVEVEVGRGLTEVAVRDGELVVAREGADGG